MKLQLILLIQAIGVAAATNTCPETTLEFTLGKKGKKVKKVKKGKKTSFTGTCYDLMDHNDKSKLCKEASNICPNSCDACDDDYKCNDAKEKFYLPSSTNTSSCKNVKKDVTMCDIDGVKEMCPKSCGVCDGTKAPTSSPAPSTSGAPSLAPSMSIAPSPAPSEITCDDSPLNVTITIQGVDYSGTCEDTLAGYDEQTIAGVCATVDGLSAHCPSVCGTCDVCVDSPFEYTEMEKKSKKKATKKPKEPKVNMCSTINKKNRKKRCKNGVKETCRAACDVCP